MLYLFYIPYALMLGTTQLKVWFLAPNSEHKFISHLSCSLYSNIRNKDISFNQIINLNPHLKIFI